MNKIANYNAYNEAMKTTVGDKLWFLPMISQEVDTIVDFGCADGSLMVEIERLYPNRFRFIGIDIDDVMIGCAINNAKAFAERTTFAHSIEDVAATIKMNNCVLVLNSVVHEICSYLTYIERYKLFDDFAKAGFKYIAIRDMHLQEWDELTNQIKSFDWYKHQDLYKMWANQHYYSKDDVNLSIEFMLKYRYRHNWTRECAERYLWNWSEMFYQFFGDKEIFETDFYVPFIFKALNEEYCTNILPFNTHKKMLIKVGG